MPGMWYGAWPVIGTQETVALDITIIITSERNYVICNYRLVFFS